MKIFNRSIALIILLTASSCKKIDEYLSKKTIGTDVVPSTLSDFRAILDNYNFMNIRFMNIGMAGTDNIYLPDANLTSQNQQVRNVYLWEKDIFVGTASADWNNTYQIIEYANIALDGLSRLDASKENPVVFNEVKGDALFFRAYCHYLLSQVYCKTYDKATAATDLGIVVRTSSDVNIKPGRATVQQTYDQMISDLKTAVELSPVLPDNRFRSCKATANSLLAKIYLVMGDYENAAKYATDALSQFNTLMDFNGGPGVTPTATIPFSTFPNNPEVIFSGFVNNGLVVSLFYSLGTTAYVDSNLYKSYTNDDMRKTLFFSGTTADKISFRGSYVGNTFAFGGIAANEIYLVRAEAYARLKKTNEALTDLNALLAKRYNTATFVPVNIQEPEALVTRILEERRKELPMTAQLRWEDLRRLNKEPGRAVQLTRRYNGNTYTLPPNDPKYVLPIPDNEIQLSGISQNER